MFFASWFLTIVFLVSFVGGVNLKAGITRQLFLLYFSISLSNSKRMLCSLQLRAHLISASNLSVPVSYQESIDFLYAFRYKATLISSQVLSVKVPEPPPPPRTVSVPLSSIKRCRRRSRR